MGSEGVRCDAVCVRVRWAQVGPGLCTVHDGTLVQAQAQSQDCRPVGLKMAPGQLSPLSFCQQNVDTQSCLGSDPAKLCSKSPW